MLIHDSHICNYKFGGIDGCKKGWLMVLINNDSHHYTLVHPITELTNILSGHIRVLVDMPVGLLSSGLTFTGNRPCDVAARKLLGVKHTSIFNPPCIEALHEKSYQQASETNYRILGKKLSKQSWNIAPKIREINAFLHLNPHWRGKILEAHPELSFQQLNGSIPLQFSKKTSEGIEERLSILQIYYPASEILFSNMLSDPALKGHAAADDMVDAICLAVLNRHRSANLENISDIYPEDSLGNRMGIWV
ncbi:MAG: DUF429 domain-containing protein [Bacteroidetes bacterium]|nr:MAG: DUF429 domain-containing protein [Bacteroidota bacterium]